MATTQDIAMAFTFGAGFPVATGRLVQLVPAPTRVRLGLPPCLDDSLPDDAVVRVESAGETLSEHPLSEAADPEDDLLGIDIQNPRPGVPYTISVVRNGDVRILLREVVLHDLVTDLHGATSDPPVLEQDGLWWDGDDEEEDDA